MAPVHRVARRVAPVFLETDLCGAATRRKVIHLPATGVFLQANSVRSNIWRLHIIIESTSMLRRPLITPISWLFVSSEIRGARIISMMMCMLCANCISVTRIDKHNGQVNIKFQNINYNKTCNNSINCNNMKCFIITPVEDNGGHCRSVDSGPS